MRRMVSSDWLALLNRSLNWEKWKRSYHCCWYTLSRSPIYNSHQIYQLLHLSFWCLSPCTASSPIPSQTQTHPAYAPQIFSRRQLRCWKTWRARTSSTTNNLFTALSCVRCYSESCLWSDRANLLPWWASRLWVSVVRVGSEGWGSWLVDDGAFSWGGIAVVVRT